MNNFWKDNYGFTLMEMLVSLMIVCSITLIMTNIFFVMKSGEDNLEYLTSITIAKTQIYEEIFFANNMNVNFDKLIFDKENNQEIEIRFEGDKLMRYVDGKGYQVLLRDISNGEFIVKNGNIFMTVEFINGEKYEVFLGPSRN